MKLALIILALALVGCQTAEQRERAALRRIIRDQVGIDPLAP